VFIADGRHNCYIGRSKGIGVPFDILVATPSDLERHKNNIGLIYRTVLQQGKDVYAA
jgi:hypothetical protein